MTRARPARETSLLLGYRIPTQPSRYRVSVWRRLQRMAAIPLHRSLFVVVDSPLNRLRLADIAHDIANWGGRAWVFRGTELASEATTGASRRPRTKEKRRASFSKRSSGESRR